MPIDLKMFAALGLGLAWTLAFAQASVAEAKTASAHGSRRLF